MALAGTTFQGALAGIRVVERADGSVPGMLCGRLLGDLGAEIIAVAGTGESHLRHMPPLAPDTGASLPFAFLTANKRLLALQAGDGSSQLTDLLAAADVLLSARAEGPPPLDLVELHRTLPRLVIGDISPFGLGGSRDLCIDDFVAFHWAGLGYLTPRTMAGYPTSGRPPLRPYSRVLEVLAGFQAAIGILAALLRRDRTGRGELLDVATIQCALPLLRRETAAYVYEGLVAHRDERLWKVAPVGVVRCADGYVFVDVVEDAQWRRLAEVIGHPELREDARYQTRDDRFIRAEEIMRLLEGWCSLKTRADLVKEGQARRIAIGPVNTPRDLAEDPQLNARNFFAPLPRDGPRILAPRVCVSRVLDSVSPGGAQPMRPGWGADDQDAPLVGVRVIEFAHVWAGPFCTQLLADLGAEVIRVESRRRLDVQRLGGPYPGGHAGLNHSGVWNSQNRGKLSCTLNLARTEGVELARRLIEMSDVVVENFSPGTLQRLGLGWETLRHINPRLVMVSLSAFGQEGPYRDYVGYGPMMDAVCGIAALTGYGDGVPRSVNGWVGDAGGAVAGAVTILAALRARNRGFGGLWADISEFEAAALFQFEALLAWLNGGQMLEPLGNHDLFDGFTQCVCCAGVDEWIAIAARNSDDLAALAEVVGRPELRTVPPRDPGTSPADRFGPLGAAVAAWAREQPRESALAALQAGGIASGPVSTMRDLLLDPQLTERHAWVEVAHPEAGPLRMYGPVWRFASADVTIARPAPCLGEHNAYVFGELLGLDSEAQQRLEREQVIY